MAYDIYIKDEIKNEIAQILGVGSTIPQKITTGALNVNNGILKIGNYHIPREHILFIKEV